MGIVTIRSNFLNLPDTVQMENGDMASYSYSPSGDKFMCIYSTANTSTVTMPLGSTLSNGRPAGITVAQNLFMLYMDNVVYEGNPWSTTLHNLSKVLTDDGILVRTNSVTESTPVFERNYYVRDHLGNVRMVFDSQGRVRQLNNYTPFGMEYGESAGNQASVGYQDYKFGGKELDRRFELNWYNFGARSYDLALGRWNSPDPLAEKYPSISPYVYYANNPVNLIDPDGKQFTPLLGITDIVMSNKPVVSETMVRVGRTTTEVSSKTAETTWNGGKAINAERVNAGRQTETQQLQKLGLEKNTESFTRTDPKTGNEGTTIPDAVKNGQTTEIKNVQKQSFTKQLRLQEKISNENGQNPLLRINKDAKISEPLQKSSFEISKYGVVPAIQDNTIVKKTIH